MLKVVTGLTLGAIITYMMMRSDPNTVESAAEAVRGIRDRTIIFLLSHGWTQEESEEMADQLINDGEFLSEEMTEVPT